MSSPVTKKDGTVERPFRRQGKSATATAVATVVGIAAATTTAIVGVTHVTATTAIIIDQQQNDDDEQDPVAIAATEQITQTHSFHPLTLSKYVARGQVVQKNFV